uniref:Receptor expression-enhancing protein n=1 Tax=Romanomermis culicivorax TaxID=13658 RepID=A0A915HLF7_ROMCU
MNQKEMNSSAILEEGLDKNKQNIIISNLFVNPYEFCRKDTTVLDENKLVAVESGFSFQEIMVSALISRVLILTIGTLYPAYKSYKGVKSRNVREYVKWMMYWIIFAFYLCVEALTDIFVAFWLPLYYEIKIIFVIWLLSPYTKGASLLYRKFVHPFLLKHEKEIDLYLEQAKKESYARVVRLGNKGINYAKEAVATAALKSHEHIVGQIRKTVSLNDVNEPQLDDNHLQNALQYNRVDEDEVDRFDLPPGVTVTSSLRVKRSKTAKQRPALTDMRRLRTQNRRILSVVNIDLSRDRNI